ncbi:MAG: fibrobacter succinogenes major paralogous domain-containing protein [Deltaproteobacteria bacterium]|nr:fibrobacter succinogenes major paralogous domain-containing protein [Deltaproteobacteria bacterium]
MVLATSGVACFGRVDGDKDLISSSSGGSSSGGSSSGASSSGGSSSGASSSGSSGASSGGSGVAAGCPGDIVDGEGHTYRTMLVGGACWMADNLDVGTRVQGTADQKNDGRIEKYCFGDRDESCAVNGGLYQLGEATAYDTRERVQGICPNGWHIPSDAEWTALEVALGCADPNNQPYQSGSDEEYRCEGLGWEGSKLGGLVDKLPGHRHYASHEKGWGDRDEGSATMFWTSTRIDVPYAAGDEYAIRRRLDKGNKKVSRYSYSQLGYSVRCVRN